MDWKQALKSRLAVSSDSKKSDQELKDEEMELFTKYYLEWKGGRKSASTSYVNIPRFYYREENYFSYDDWDSMFTKTIHYFYS
ncbi:serine/threonine-protein phosphatase 2A regulatory subunit B'' subunit gamma [Crotalus adamanteus]|uniref:Serine/threonine-protein phosphatase 2A regulatory subunit B'' subunit gamma n=1 Tax=Crotalus adamanteus TaxID=8729 RepID=A0AAW1C670_CROAD